MAGYQLFLFSTVGEGIVISLSIRSLEQNFESASHFTGRQFWPVNRFCAWFLGGSALH